MSACTLNFKNYVYFCRGIWVQIPCLLYIINIQLVKEQCVRRLLDSGLDFALYRFPGEREPHLVLQTNGEALALKLPHGGLSNASSNSLLPGNEPSGFIFAPFIETAKIPTLLIRPDVAVSGWELIDLETRELGRHRRVSLSSIELEDKTADIEQSDGYKVAFRSFKYQLDRENYQKLVLSFSQLKDWEGAGHEDELFVRAMERFPNSMVYLVYTRVGGRWFGCTPELLLEGYGMKWHTMALAGTRTWEYGDWNEKNTHEQRMVSDYVEGQLQSLGARITRHGPYTSKAGHLYHLRTDYTFHLPTATSPLKILNLLHPTPALCGLPKMEAWNFIRLFERNKRMYYGGYLGPLNLRAETNIYVNIRCAQIRPNGKALFFAGGGLTRNSIFSEEKEEIKRKMETLLAALS